MTKQNLTLIQHRKQTTMLKQQNQKLRDALQNVYEMAVQGIHTHDGGTSYFPIKSIVTDALGLNSADGTINHHGFDAVAHTSSLAGDSLRHKKASDGYALCGKAIRTDTTWSNDSRIPKCQACLRVMKRLQVQETSDKPKEVRYLYTTIGDEDHSLLNLIFSREYPILDLERAGYLASIARLTVCEFVTETVKGDGIRYLKITDKGREYAQSEWWQ